MKDKVVEALGALEESITRLEDEPPSWALKLSEKIDRMLTVILETSKGVDEFRTHAMENLNQIGSDVKKIDSAANDHEVRITRLEYKGNGSAKIPK